MDTRKGKNQEIGRSAVTWDAAGMTTVFGTVWNVIGTREEISLLFASRSLRTGDREETITLSDRIILSPHTAKRLLVLLRKIMARHQQRFGAGLTEPRMFTEASN